MKPNETSESTGLPEPLLTLNEAAQVLRISRWTMYQLINKNRLKTVRINERRLVTTQDLRQFIEDLRDEEEVTNA